MTDSMVSLEPSAGPKIPIVAFRTSSPSSTSYLYDMSILVGTRLRM